MRKRSAVILAAVIAAAPLSQIPSVHAHTPLTRLSTPMEMTEEANLVFVGEVAKVMYRKAHIEGGEGELPYTIVTYRVRDVLRGKSPGDTFTMRFQGGSDGQGGFVEVSGVPLFQTGEQDLLFVRNNGEKGCPLVDCERGRFRILKDAVYNTHGAPVRGMSETRIIARGAPPEEFRKFRYPAPHFDELIKNPEVKRRLKEENISLDDARRRYESEAPKEIEVRWMEAIAKENVDGLGAEESAAGTRNVLNKDMQTLQPTAVAPAEKLSSKAVGREQFVSMIKSAAGKAKRAPTTLKSIDPDAEIVIKFTGPKSPPERAVKKIADRMATPEEEAEIKALKAQNFNPVIKR